MRSNLKVTENGTLSSMVTKYDTRTLKVNACDHRVMCGYPELRQGEGEVRLT